MASFYARLRLSPEKEALLEKIILDRFTEPFGADRAAYDRLAEQLLTPAEYAEYARDRDDMPTRSAIDQAVADLRKIADADTVQALTPVVDAVLRASPLNGDAIWLESRATAKQPALTETEIASVGALAMQRFNAQLARLGRSLTAEQQARLRQWFDRTVVQFHLRGLRRAGPGGG